MDVDVRRATLATYAAFIASGIGLATWLARIPQIRDQLHLDPSALGLVLLAVSAGAVLALPLAGPLVARVGSRRTVAATTVLFGAGLAVVAVGTTVGVAPVAAGLFVLGFATGGWDVAMNVQGTVVERALGRSIMPRFHAGFSLGTVVGSLVTAAMVAAHVPVAVHLAVVAVLVAAVVPVVARRFVADRDGPDRDGLGRDGLDRAELDRDGLDHERSGRDGSGRDRVHRPGGALGAWRERRTVLLGFFVLAFTFAEGAGNDWISVAAIDGRGVPPSVATLAFAAFLAAMTVGRWFGPALLDRYGRVPVVRALALAGAVGAALFVFAPTPLAFLGTLLWGVGIALGFPVGMSAAADDPASAAARVGVISSIGYCAFLAGPPAIGFLGEQVTVLRALVTVAVLLGVAALCAAIVAPSPLTEAVRR